MKVNAQALEEELHATVCVIGAGPAGIACACELAKRNIDVLLIESGDYEFSPASRELSRAEIVDTQSHAAMQIAVRRVFGGTSWLWGGRCVPLDRIDFEPRKFAPGIRWPISYSDLLPFYSAACEYANCGDAIFAIGHVKAPTAVRPITERFVPGTVSAESLERWSGEPNFAHRYKNWLERSSTAKLLANATCVSIKLSETRDDVKHVIVKCEGKSKRVVASYFVVACGGLETTRLLLNSNLTQDNRLGNRSGLLGRYYMGHISGKIASAAFSGRPSKTLSGFERDERGFYVRRRFKLAEKAQIEHEVLNTVLWLDNPPLADSMHGNGILSAAYLALTTPGISKFLAPKAIADSVTKAGPNCSALAHLKNVVRDFPAVVSFAPSFLYRRYVARPRLPGFFLPNARNMYAIHYHAEQLPRDDSIVSLCDEMDQHGMHRIRVHLKYSLFDAESVVRCHEIFDRHLRRTGAGELKYWFPESERVSAVIAQASDGFHQIGTTRMAERWQVGVVNSDCRVFGTSNLFVASSSVFPSSGQANPTLTIIALSIRIAGHIARLCGAK